MSFGNRLRNLRLENNMTQEDLSKMLNVSRATVGRYETDERFPDKDTLKKIADIFDVSIDYLLERTNNKNTYANSNNFLCEKYLESSISKEVENEIIKKLLKEDIINTEEYIPEDILKNILKYGIEAAIKIAKLENEIKQLKNIHE